MLAARDTFAATRRSRIAELSTDLLSVTSHADRYNIYRGLYGQYRRFRIDSAMLIAEVIGTEWYDLQGLRVSEPTKGLYIRCVTYSDGTVIREKIVL